MLRHTIDQRVRSVALPFAGHYAQVARAPLAYSMAGGYAAHLGSATLAHKLHRYAYIGIRSQSEPTLSCHDVTCSDGRSVPSGFLDRQMLQVIWQFCLLQGYITQGILCEVHYDVAWFDQSAAVTALGIAILAHAGRWGTDVAQDVQILSPDEWISTYPEQWAFLWKLHVIASMHCHYTFCGAELAAALFPSRYPLLYMLEYNGKHPLLAKVFAGDLMLLGRSDVPRCSVLRLEDVGIHQPYPLELGVLSQESYRAAHYVSQVGPARSQPGDLSGFRAHSLEQLLPSVPLYQTHIAAIHTSVMQAFEELITMVVTQQSERFLEKMQVAHTLLRGSYGVHQPLELSSITQQMEGHVGMVTEKMSGKHLRACVFVPVHSTVLDQVADILLYRSGPDLGQSPGAGLVQTQDRGKIHVDWEHGTMHIDDHRVTSHDLPSVRYLLHVLRHCRDGHTRIALSDLPRASYTAEIREFKNKIVLPFVRLMERYGCLFVPLSLLHRDGVWYVECAPELHSLLASGGKPDKSGMA